MRKITIIIAAFLLICLLAPVGADNPGRLRELEEEIKSLQTKVEALELKTAYLRSDVDYMFTEPFAEYIFDLMLN